MSKSLGNCIYLADSPEEIKRKIMGMFTDPNHLRVEDPGKTDNNPVFAYLDAFCQDYHFSKYLPEYNNLAELKAHYQKGGLGDMKIKGFLNDVIQEELKPIRERREQYAKNLEEVYQMLEEGSQKARLVAITTLKKVRRAIGLEYFEKKND